MTDEFNNIAPEQADNSHFEGLSQEDIQELIQVFVEDSNEQLDRLNEILMAVEKKELHENDIQDLYRIFHSFKGSAASFGYQKMSEIAHKLEDILMPVRDNRINISQPLLNLLYHSLDQFRAALQIIQSGKAIEGSLHPLLVKISQFSGEPQKDASKPETESFQSKQNAQLEFEKEIALREESIRIKLQKINRLIDLSSEMAVRKNYGQVTIPKIMGVLSRIQDEEQRLVQIFKKNGTSGRQEQIHFERDKGIREHTTFLGEINDGLKSLLDDFSRWYFQLNILAEELRYEALMTRMFPFLKIIGPMRRMVRDYTVNTGKVIDLMFEGEDTELDRRILEGIKDPLMHLVRNAVDHGIENPEERVHNGKASLGTVTIKTVQKGNEILISVSDDGRGIDVESVREKAMEKLVPAFSLDDIMYMDSDKVTQFIFHPGFSTAEKTTDISGRGVGLDVVQENIKQLHGSITVNSTRGKGTVFLIRIPSTLTISNVLLFEAAGFTFAINTSYLEALARAPEISAEKSALHGKVEYNGSEYPVLNLERCIGMKSRPETGKHRDTPHEGRNIILFTPAIYPIALLADRFLDIQEIVVRPLQLSLPGAQYFSGITFLPDGSLAFIIDPAALIANYRTSETSEEEIPAFMISIKNMESSLSENRIALPLILAMVGEEVIGIPSHWVLKRFRIPRPQKRSKGGRRKLVLGAKKISLLDMGACLGISTNPDPAEVVILLCKINNRHAALEVDTVLSSVEGAISFDRQNNVPGDLYAITNDEESVRVLEPALLISLLDEGDKSASPPEMELLRVDGDSDNIRSEKENEENLLVCFETCGRNFGVSFDDVIEILPVAEILRFDSDENNPRGFVNLRGECIEIFDMREWLKQPDSAGKNDRALLVVQNNDIRRGLVVGNVITDIAYLDKEKTLELPVEVVNLYPRIYVMDSAQF